MSKKLKILYAEDDREVASSIARMITLNENVDKIDIANNGIEMIEFFKQKDDYDIIISDIEMPKLNGIEAIKEIKKNNPELFTVITTAFSEKDYLVDSIETGIDKYLLKPLDLNKLINIINKFYADKNIKLEHQYQKDMLILQSKAASLGFMIDAVAHQWKQPLSVISILNSNIGFQIENNSLDINQLKGFTEDIKDEIDHMMETLMEFRSFSRTDREKIDFSMKECMQKVMMIMKHELKNKNIELRIDSTDDFMINGYINQFIHILLNFISNSIDAFEENEDIQNRVISIYLKRDETYDKIVYEDNAGGISDLIIEKVFDMDFTTKAGSKGTGIGLYLSNIIANNHNAAIDVENVSDGVKFTISINR